MSQKPTQSPWRGLLVLALVLVAAGGCTATKFPKDGAGYLVLPGAEDTQFDGAPSKPAEAMAGQSRDSFPELVDMDVEQAKAQLQAEFPSLNINPVPQGSMVTMDYRTDRVRIFFDPATNKVTRVPRIG